MLSEQWTLGGDARQAVTKADIDEVVSRWTGIPITSLKEEESEKLLRMEEELHRRIVSQDGAISAVARAIRRTRAGLKNPNRPVGSFLFLGPTGVGKTEVARGLAAFLFGSERNLIRFDMSEYMEKHSVCKLIGSPPGYVGHEEGGQLTERVKRNPYCVVLLDEIEKAHPDIFNVLLQVFEDGHLTDGLGNTVDFKNTILIMTSNIGARFIEKKGRMGFASSEPGQTVQATNEMVMGEVKRTFNPEFVNRIDEIIIFDALSDADLVKITRLLVEQLNENLQGEGHHDLDTGRGGRVAPGAHAAGPLLRRAAAAAGDPASHRGRALGGLHPRPGARGPADRGGREGRGAVVPARRAGRSAVGMKRTRAAVLGAWLSVAVPAAEARAQAAAAAPGAGGGADRDPQQPVPPEGDAALLRLHEAGRRLRRAQAARGLQAPVGHGLPRRPADRRAWTGRAARWCASR